MDAKAAWFFIQPVGRNTLASMVKNMCSQIGVTGKTNHSLCATGATRLFEANVPEKLIQERTGHKSTDALGRYVRTSVVQQKAVLSVICASNFTSFQTTVVESAPCRSATVVHKTLHYNTLHYSCSLGSLAHPHYCVRCIIPSCHENLKLSWTPFGLVKSFTAFILSSVFLAVVHCFNVICMCGRPN